MLLVAREVANMPTFFVVLLFVAAVTALVLAILYVRERGQRRYAESNATRAEAARLDALETVGKAGEVRRALRAEHAAEMERATAAHSETIDALARANERADAATAESATARQWNATAARTHAVEVGGYKAELAAARRTIDRLEDQRSVAVELARGILSEK